MKDITYYKSQPWGFDSNLLLGFFATLDGDDTITREEEELSEALWVNGTDMEFTPDGISLTNEMMEHFYNEKARSKR